MLVDSFVGFVVCNCCNKNLPIFKLNNASTHSRELGAFIHTYIHRYICTYSDLPNNNPRRKIFFQFLLSPQVSVNGVLQCPSWTNSMSKLVDCASRNKIVCQFDTTSFTGTFTYNYILATFHISVICIIVFLFNIQYSRMKASSMFVLKNRIQMLQSKYKNLGKHYWDKIWIVGPFVLLRHVPGKYAMRRVHLHSSMVCQP
jgi:hypothetical protein